MSMMIILMNMMMKMTKYHCIQNIPLSAWHYHLGKKEDQINNALSTQTIDSHKKEAFVVMEVLIQSICGS